MNDKQRLLVVDDDEDIRELLTELLTRAGYQVDIAPMGAAPCARSSRRRPRSSSST